MPEMIYVDSSNIEAIGYDDTNRDLHVQFRTGTCYIYHGVPSEVYQSFLDAPSKGSFLNRELKAVYQFTKQ